MRLYSLASHRRQHQGKTNSAKRTCSPPKIGNSFPGTQTLGGPFPSQQAMRTRQVRANPLDARHHLAYRLRPASLESMSLPACPVARRPWPPFFIASNMFYASWQDDRARSTILNLTVPSLPHKYVRTSWFLELITPITLSSILGSPPYSPPTAWCLSSMQ